MNNKIRYEEGTWFLLPLRDGGFARGVVARLDGKGSAFGYFFGPVFKSPEDAQALENLSPKAAVFLCIFGDLGLLNGDWKIIGQLENWRREEWAIPPFLYHDDSNGKIYLRYYDDKSLAFLRESETDQNSAGHCPKDGCFGYGAVELCVTAALRGT